MRMVCSPARLVSILSLLALCGAAMPAAAQHLAPLSLKQTQRAEKQLDAFAEAQGEIYRLAEICALPMTGFSRASVLNAGSRFTAEIRVTALMWWDTGHHKDVAACDDAAKQRLAALKQKAEEARAALEAASVERDADGAPVTGDGSKIP